MIGYAVGVYRQEEVVASLSVYLPAYRHTPDKAIQVLNNLRQAAEHIGRELALP